MSVRDDLPYPWSVLRPFLVTIDTLAGEDLDSARQILKVLIKWDSEKEQWQEGGFESDGLAEGLLTAFTMGIEGNEPLAQAMATAIKKHYGPTESDWPGWLRNVKEALAERDDMESEEKDEEDV